MFELKNKSWKNWLNQRFLNKLSAVLVLVLLVFITVWKVDVWASYFDPAYQTNYFGESSSVKLPSQQNDSGQISNEVRQRLTNEPTPPNQSISAVEPLGSDACVEWYQIFSGECIIRLIVNSIGYIIMIIFALIGALIDIGVFFSFQLIEFLLSGNPTAQGSDFWFIAQQIYPVLLNIALLLILFSFYYVGFQYLFGIKNGRVAWQEFLAKVVLAVILVNFSVFLVSIFVSFLHDIGSLFANIYAQDGGSVGGAFQNAMKKAAGYNVDANAFTGFWSTLPSPFSPIGDFWTLVLVRIIYVAVSIFILISLFRLVKIAITRFVLLFLLLVISPLGVVLFFSPIKKLKEKGDQWLQTLWSQSILYPFFTVAMAIGTVFIVNFANVAVPVNELQYIDEAKLSTQFPRILALLVAFGVIQVIVNFFEKQFEGIASSTWAAIKMGTVGGASLLAGSALTTWSTASNLFKGAQIGARAGGQRFGLAGAIGGGILGGLVGSGIGVKKGIDRTTRFAAGAASVVDLLGGEKVADKLANAPGILGKTFRAAQAQNQAFFANFTGLLAKKASFATTEWLRKFGFGDDALQLRRDIDIAIDMLLPTNDYTGDSRGDLPGIVQGYRSAETAAKLAGYRSYGYDPKLSSSQVLQRLNDIVTGNTPEELQEDYSKYPESIKEIAEEIIKRPEIISKLTPQQIEFFRANYGRLIRDISGWEEFVTNGGGVLLANEEKRKLVAQDDAAEGIEAVRQGKVNRRNFDDPVYLAKYVATLRANPKKSKDLEELGKILNIDFSAFEKIDLNRFEQEYKPYVESFKNLGLSADVNRGIFKQLAEMDDIGTLDTKALRERVKDTSERYLKEQFFKVNQVGDIIRQISSDANLRDRPVDELLTMLTKDNQNFKDFVDHLKSQELQINNITDLQGAVQDYMSFVNEATTAFVNSDRIIKVTGEFQQTNAAYQSKVRDYQVNITRTPAPAAPAPAEQQQQPQKVDPLANIVGPDGSAPIRQAVASRQARSSASGSNNTNNNNNQGGNNNGGNTGSTRTSPSNQSNSGPQSPAPASSSSSSNASPAPAVQATTGGSGGGSPAASAAQPQPNIQVNITANLQDLQKTSQQVTSFISGQASNDLKKAMENINRLVQNTIQKIQNSPAPSGINQAELEKKIKAIIEAQNRIGEGVNKVYKPGAKVDVNHPEIGPYIQSIAQTLIDIGNIYNSPSNINNQNQGGGS